MATPRLGASGRAQRIVGPTSAHLAPWLSRRPAGLRYSESRSVGIGATLGRVNPRSAQTQPPSGVVDFSAAKLNESHSSCPQHLRFVSPQLELAAA